MSDLDLFPQGWLDAHLRSVVARLRALPTELRPRLTGKRAFVNEYLDRPVQDESADALPMNEWGVRYPNGKMLSWTFDEPETAQRYADRSEGSVVCRQVTEWVSVTGGESNG